MGRKGLVGELKNNNKKRKKEKNSWVFNWSVGEDETSNKTISNYIFGIKKWKKKWLK